MPRILALTALMLFVAIGAAVLLKKGKGNKEEIVAEVVADVPVEVELEKEVQEIAPRIEPQEIVPQEEVLKTHEVDEPIIEEKIIPKTSENLPDANRIEEFFSKTEPRLPIVETITYQSKVPWQKGRPAWLSDYASHYQTSRHFIARSLNGKPDYLKQDIADGDRFNVLRLDKKVDFYLLVDLSRSKMWFYYIDKGTNERVLLKTYPVGLGRLDVSKPSGSLTPLGKYVLGSKVATYKPKMTGFHGGKKVEMVRVFGTRWIPFDKEIGEASAPAKGLGIQGAPWIEKNGESVQDDSVIGKYETDGCVRLSTTDVEELFAIIITKPTTIELVKDFNDAKLPGKESSSQK